MNDLDMIKSLKSSIKKNQATQTSGVAAEIFSYDGIDAETAEYLKDKRSQIEFMAHETRARIGAHLGEAQTILAKRGYGCFGAWCESMGLARQKAYDYINYYKLLVENPDKYELIEGLQLSLAGEIAKPNAPQELKDKVLSGEIDKHNKYKAELEAMKAKLAAANKELAEAKEDNMTLFDSNKDLYTKLDKEMKKKVEPVPPPDYEQLKEEKASLEHELRQAKDKIDHLYNTAKAQEGAMKAHEAAGQAVQSNNDPLESLESKAATMQYLTDTLYGHKFSPEQKNRLARVANAITKTGGQLKEIISSMDTFIDAEVIENE